MKILQSQVSKIYRFRCDRCKSKFEMTEEEKLDNDWKYNESFLYKDRNEPGAFPNNPLHKFDCPICGCQRYVMRNDFHEYFVMNDGEEIQQY